MLSNTLANIPATALTGTLFIATDTFALYRYNGSTWQLIGGPGTGTITGSGANGQIAYFNASSVLTSSSAFTVSGNRMTIRELQTNTDADLNGVIFGRGGSGKVFNTAGGGGALGSNTTAVDGYNVALGFEALGNHTTPQNCVAIGAYSLGFGTGFGINNAVGYAALRELTTGTQNNAIGYEAIFGCTTGSSNTGIGHTVMYFTTTGSRNTAIGNSALNHASLGNDNVAIGNDAGSNTGNGNSNSSPIQSIYIGSVVKSINGTGGQTNEIVIGYNAVGNGSNTVTLGNTSIVNTYLQGTVNASHVAVVKSNSGIAIAITDSANGNALNINKTGSGFAIQVTAGTVSFADNTAMSVNSGSGATVGNGNIDPFGRENDKTFSVNSVGNSAIAINAATGAGRGALIDFGTNGVRTAELISNVNETTLGTLINKPLKFAVNGIEQSRFAESTGNLLIATTTDNLTDKLQVNGSITSNQHITALNYISSTEIVSSSLLTLRFNAAKLIGRNGADTLYYELIKVNSSDQIEIDSSAVGTVFGSYIKTSNPAAGTAQAWKLGSYVSGAIAATGYVQIDIAGNAYKLLTST